MKLRGKSRLGTRRGLFFLVSILLFIFFSISSAEALISVDPPNSASWWRGGGTYTIQWGADVGPAVIYYSTDDGLTFPNIVTTEASGTSYSWTIPMVPEIDSQTVKIMVVGSDVGTSETFTIDSVYPVVNNIGIIPKIWEAGIPTELPEDNIVGLPAGTPIAATGETWEIGWTAYDNFAVSPEGISLYYSLDNGQSYPPNQLIAEGISSSESAYTWVIPDITSIRTKIKVVVLDMAGNENKGESDVFVIDSEGPTLEVTTPNAESYVKGSPGRYDLVTYDITWIPAIDNVGTSQESVSMEYSIGGGFSPLFDGYHGEVYGPFWVENEFNDGLYTWQVFWDSTYAYHLDNVIIRVHAKDLKGNDGYADSQVFRIDYSTPEVTIDSPIASATWIGGTSYEVQWSDVRDMYVGTKDFGWGFGTEESVSIYLSLDGGQTYPITLVEGTSTESLAPDSTYPLNPYYSPGGGYKWTVPDTIDSDHAKIRVAIEDYAGNIGSSESDEFFITSTLPFVQVTNPQGGELLDGRTSINISWEVRFKSGLGLDPGDLISIYYSTNSGQTFPNEIVSGRLPDDNGGGSWPDYYGTYSWDINGQIDSNTVRIRVIANEQDTGKIGSDECNSDIAVDSTRPYVELTSPTGGEGWKGGQTYDITWAASDEGSGLPTDAVSIYYSTDGGNLFDNFVPDAQGISNEGTFSWTTPTINEADVQLKVVVVDEAGLDNHAISGNFVIDSVLPEVELLAPQAGDYLIGATTYEVHWRATDNVLIAEDGISLWWKNEPDQPSWWDVRQELNNATGSDEGTYVWTLPNVDSETVSLEVRVVDHAGHSTKEAIGPFTIMTPPVVLVYHPSSGEVYEGGTAKDITWYTNDFGVGLADTGVAIYISTDEAATYELLTSEASNNIGPYNGYYTWDIPDGVDWEKCKIRIHSYDSWLPVGNLGTGESDNFFPILEHPTVQVGAPNGGEEFVVDSICTITWEAWDNTALAVDPIDIYYSTDGGLTYTNLITSEIAHSGTYDWTVPDIDSTDVRIQARAKDQYGVNYGVWGSDTSDANFTIYEAPTVEVRSPLGGEVFQASVDTLTISWEAWDNIDLANNPISIYYSTDGGLTYPYTIATGISYTSGEASYDWDIPYGVESKQTKISVVAEDTIGKTGSDESNEFTITYNPTVEVTAPVSGESIAGGTTYEVQWTASDNVPLPADAISIYYATFEGDSYHEIATGEANDGSYDWFVPVLNTQEAKIRIVVEDSIGNVVTDEVDNYFTIDSIFPTVEVTAPNGGEYLKGGDQYIITWEATGDNYGLPAQPISIYYVVEGNSPVLITPEVADTGAYDWTVADIDSDQVRIMVSITDLAGNVASSLSDNYLAIDSTAPTGDVLFPDGGEILRGGLEYLVQWAASDNIKLADNPFSLYCVTSETIVIAENIASSETSIPWTVPLIDAPLAKIRLLVEDEVGHISTIESGGSFIVNTSLPPVVVTTPEAGVLWLGNTVYDISWVIAEPEGLVPNSLTLSYSPTGAPPYTEIVSGLPIIPTTYSWLTPPDLDSDTARVRLTVRDEWMGIGTSESDVFLIMVPPEVNLTYPNGGEILQGGSTAEVTWVATDNAGFPADAVSLSFTTDGGNTYIPIVSGIPNSGSYDWYITPDTDAAAAKVRIEVRDEYNNADIDESDASFHIDSSRPSVDLVYPNTGEKWRGGEVYTIRWTASDDVELDPNPITLYYSADSGNTYTLIKTDLPNTGSCDWTPTIHSDQVRVKVVVKDKAGNEEFDRSDNDFIVDSQVPVVSVIAPSGDERWQTGTTHDITWNASDSFGLADFPISIYYSTNNGATYPYPVAVGIVHTGSYTWTIPAVDSPLVRVKVVAVDEVGNSAFNVSSDDLLIGDFSPPLITNFSVNGTKIFTNDIISATPLIEADIADSSGVDTNSIKITIDTTVITMGITKTPVSGNTDYHISYQLAFPLSSPAWHSIAIEAADILGEVSTEEVDNLEVKSGAVGLVGTPLNEPNPFSTAQGTNIAYTLTLDANVTIYMYDLSARLIWSRTYLSGTQGGSAGYNEIFWSGLTDFGEAVGNGMYLYRIVADGVVVGKGKVAVYD